MAVSRRSSAIGTCSRLALSVLLAILASTCVQSFAPSVAIRAGGSALSPVQHYTTTAVHRHQQTMVWSPLHICLKRRAKSLFLSGGAPAQSPPPSQLALSPSSRAQVSLQAAVHSCNTYALHALALESLCTHLIGVQGTWFLSTVPTSLRCMPQARLACCTIINS
jgi:hypothetical protein